MGIILVSGLVLPASVTDKFTNKKTTDTQVVALDSSGKPIEGATIQQNPDGTQTVVDQNGAPIPEATATDPAAATPAPSPSSPTPAPSPTPTPAPAPAPTPAPTPAPAPAPTPAPAPAPAPAPTYCGGKTPCYGRGDLAAHASTSNCWGYNADIMFNLSGYAPSHPDGASKVLQAAICGKDISGVLGGGNTPAGSHTHKSATRNNTASSQLLSAKVGYYDASKP